MLFCGLAARPQGGRYKKEFRGSTTSSIAGRRSRLVLGVVHLIFDLHRFSLLAPGAQRSHDLLRAVFLAQFAQSGSAHPLRYYLLGYASIPFIAVDMTNFPLLLINLAKFRRKFEFNSSPLLCYRPAVALTFCAARGILLFSSPRWPPNPLMFFIRLPRMPQTVL